MSNFDDLPLLQVMPQPLPAGHPDLWADTPIYDTVIHDLGFDPAVTYA
jgi:hypothetical protein